MEILANVEAMTSQDWPDVERIYSEGIATGNATFEQSAPNWETWDSGHLQVCRLVARDRFDVLGWAALSSISRRSVYAGVAEASVYVTERVRGQKIGSALLDALVTASESEGVWTLQAGIFPENTARIQLHRHFGFSMVGTRQRLGCMNGRWRDVILMERRSQIVGID